jgi:hypothetical protein
MALDIIIALVVAGILLVLAEIFIPGGIAGTIGSFLILAGIVAGFHRDPTLGFGLLIGALGFGALAYLAPPRRHRENWRPQGRCGHARRDDRAWQQRSRDRR